MWSAGGETPDDGVLSTVVWFDQNKLPALNSGQRPAFLSGGAKEYLHCDSR